MKHVASEKGTRQRFISPLIQIYYLFWKWF